MPLADQRLVYNFGMLKTSLAVMLSAVSAFAAGAATLMVCKVSAETQEQGGGQNPPDEQHERKRLEPHHGIRSLCLRARIVPTGSCGFKGDRA